MIAAPLWPTRQKGPAAVVNIPHSRRRRPTAPGGAVTGTAFMPDNPRDRWQFPDNQDRSRSSIGVLSRRPCREAPPPRHRRHHVRPGRRRLWLDNRPGRTPDPRRRHRRSPRPGHHGPNPGRFFILDTVMRADHPAQTPPPACRSSPSAPKHKTSASAQRCLQLEAQPARPRRPPRLPRSQQPTKRGPLQAPRLGPMLLPHPDRRRPDAVPNVAPAGTPARFAKPDATRRKPLRCRRRREPGNHNRPGTIAAAEQDYPDDARQRRTDDARRSHHRPHSRIRVEAFAEE